MIRREHFLAMKDGAVVCNSGHFDVELGLAGPQGRVQDRSTADVRKHVDEYTLKNGQRIYVLGARAGWSTWPWPKAIRRASWT